MLCICGHPQEDHPDSRECRSEGCLCCQYEENYDVSES